MSLDSLLKPAKWLDEQILRQYTKIGERFNLEKGRRKYIIGFGLGAVGILELSLGINYMIPAETIQFPYYIFLFVPDGSYSLRGILGSVDEDVTSEARAVQPAIYFSKKFNSLIRMPTFASGAGFVGKFVIDYFQGEAYLGSTSTGYLLSGLGLITLASSMYIKSTDPKLLDKEPIWKKACNWVKEKASGLIPLPEPEYLLKVQLD